MTTNITDEHRMAFNAMTSGEYDNFALFSCFVNGTPTSAICAVVRTDHEFTITPLFIALTPDMVITDHNGMEAAA